MSMKTYTEAMNRKRTPQREPIPGVPQVQNSAGGFVFKVDDFKRLERFLILGSEGGTYYVGERKLTKDNAECVLRCLKADGARTVSMIAEVSHQGRAPKNDPAIFALAMAMKLAPDSLTRRAAAAMVGRVCRTGTHLFQFVEAVNALGGWGRLTKRAVSEWYLSKDADSLARQVSKYQQRDGWSHRDLLRLAHVKPPDSLQSVLRWAAGKKPPESKDGGTFVAHPLLHAFVELKARVLENGAEKSVRYACDAIITYALPRECIPSELLNSPEVWEALLHSNKNPDASHGMPVHAMVRNLGKMTSIGLLKSNSEAARAVCEHLTDGEAIRKARLHPIAILLAMSTYGLGHGLKGALSWQPVQMVMDALDAAFTLAFQAVEPTGKRYLIALDVSGSMDSPIAGTNLSCREAAAAMALVTARTEKLYEIVAFTSGMANEFIVGAGRSKWGQGYRSAISPVAFSARTTLESACNTVKRMPMGGTDCALPMLYAKERELDVDVFEVLTDNETWAGDIHPMQALNDYRQASGIPAKLCVVGMTSTEFSIADPNDAGTLDCVGFDASTPAIIADFAKQ